MADSQNATDVSDAISFYKQVVMGGQPRQQAQSANSLDAYITPTRSNGGNQRMINDNDIDAVSLFAEITK